MRKTKSISRRNFLGGVVTASGVLAAPHVIPASALGKEGALAPSERITLGIIGTGSHGVSRNIKRFLPEPDAQIVAVCDVDRQRRIDAKKLIETRYAEKFQGTYKGCDDYNDFRDIIARDDIDAVMVATPDHWHVIPSVMAARAGKDVMCEKPLSLTILEGRILSDAIKTHNRVFQTATENRSDINYHRMIELVRNGRIGKLHTIRVDLPGGYSAQEQSFETCQPPEGFDYNMWLGQAPEAPYCPARIHWNFRWILDYSGGMLTDWGAHMIDLAQWGNDTEYTGPIEVEGKGKFPKEGLYNAATKFRVECKFANDVKMIIRSKSPALRFEGTEGWIANDGWRAELKASDPKILEEKIGTNELQLYTCPQGEQRNFLDCVKSRELCYAPVEVGHRTITIAHLGNISMVLGRKLRWNPDIERFINDPVADWLLSRPMREPWTL
jgi:predicted dehydrogenase